MLTAVAQEGIAVAAPSFDAPAPVGTSRDEVLAAAQHGDGAAFAVLVRRHQSMVFSLALHVLRSRTAAEDLAQEVFLELFRNLPRLESAAHVVSWLRRVTSHRCIDQIRRQRHRPETTVDELPDRGAMTAPRDVLLHDRLHEVLSTLRPQARLVVVLRFQEGLEPAEIADALAMSINTVKSHLRRSLAVLRERLERGPKRARP